MTTTFLIALSNGLAKLKCSREDCSNQATETFDGEVYCYPCMVAEERANE